MKVSNDDHVTIKFHFAGLALVSLSHLHSVKKFISYRSQFFVLLQVAELEQVLSHLSFRWRHIAISNISFSKYNDFISKNFLFLQNHCQTNKDILANCENQ